jgi:hypothetical protein
VRLTVKPVGEMSEDGKRSVAVDTMNPITVMLAAIILQLSSLVASWSSYII